MEDLHREVARFLREQGVGRDAALLVAVSGGADSVALLHGLLALGQRVVVAHVHHGLRGEAADRDRDFVCEQARRLGVELHVRRVDATRRDGRSPEARARELRYAALEEMRGEGGCAFIATAHTRDDQAETVLLRAIRGTGLAGLAGIAPRSADGVLLRPLLRVRRGEIRRYLRERELRWCEDASNADLRIPRNRVRAQVLPLLEAIHPGALERLAALAAHGRELASWLAASADPALTAAIEAGEGGLWIDPDPLQRLEPPCEARALAGLLSLAGLRAELSSLHLRRVRGFLREAGEGKALSLPRRTVLLRDGDRFWLGPEPGPRTPAAFRARLHPPTGLELPERGVRLIWCRADAAARDDVGGSPLLLPAPLPGPLIARSPEPGDTMQENARALPLSDLFARARWSRRDRARAVVVELSQQVIGVLGPRGALRPRRDRTLVDGRVTDPPSVWQLLAEALSPVPGSC